VLAEEGIGVEKGKKKKFEIYLIKLLKRPINVMVSFVLQKVKR
jgi:hypothetical protein